MISTFQSKFNDLIENAVWIKKLKVITPVKTKGVTKPKKERSQVSKIPPKVEKKIESPVVEPPRKRAFAYSRKAQGEKQPHQRKYGANQIKENEFKEIENNKQCNDNYESTNLNTEKLKQNKLKQENHDPDINYKINKLNEKQKSQKDDNLVNRKKTKDLAFNIKKAWSTLNHKDDIISGFGRNTISYGKSNNKYGFGEMRNMRKL